MLIILLSLIVCIIAVIILFKARPNLFIFRLIEKILGKKYFFRRGSVFIADTEQREREGGDIIHVTKL